MYVSIMTQEDGSRLMKVRIPEIGEKADVRYNAGTPVSAMLEDMRTALGNRKLND
jgi:hypothetical protein